MKIELDLDQWAPSAIAKLIAAIDDAADNGDTTPTRWRLTRLAVRVRNYHRQSNGR